MEKSDFFLLIYNLKKKKFYLKMLKAYKYRIYPNQEQKEMMTKIFGQVRFVYNLGLETKISAYTGNKINIDCFDWTYEEAIGFLSYSDFKEYESALALKNGKNDPRIVTIL